VLDCPREWHHNGAICNFRRELGLPRAQKKRRRDRYNEAEQVYRDDLKRLPDNGWSLFGLANALEMQRKPAEAAPVLAKFKRIWAKADVTIKSSCFCQPGT